MAAEFKLFRGGTDNPAFGVGVRQQVVEAGGGWPERLVHGEFGAPGLGEKMAQGHYGSRTLTRLRGDPGQGQYACEGGGTLIKGKQATPGEIEGGAAQRQRM